MMSLALHQGYAANDLCHNAIVHELLHANVLMPVQVAYNEVLLGSAAAWL